MIDIERSLGELADRLEIRGGDWLVDDVVRRIGEPARGPQGRRVLLLAVASVVIVAVAVFGLPGPRHAVGRWLGFDSVRIEPGVTVPVTTSVAPTVTQVVTPTATTTVATTITTTIADALNLGPVLSIDEARSQTGLADPTPALLGDPQSVHVVRPPDSGQIVLVYAPSDLVPQSAVTGVGALVSIMPATINEGYFHKILGDEATVQSVDVGGAPGYWIEGSPHQLFFQVGELVVPDTLRLATNTLLWQRGDDVYRIEADISMEAALRIAESIP
jgi:hypothetical protein